MLEFLRRFRSVFLFAPLFLACVVVLASLSLLETKKNPKKLNGTLEVSRAFEEVKHLYQQGNLEQAHQKMEGRESSLILLEEGCQLVISIYARLEDYKSLKEYSKRCFHHPTNRDVAYEGYAKASLELAQISEGIVTLKEELVKHSSERLIASLAQLYFYEKQYTLSRQYFETLVKDSELWSAWLYRALKFKALFRDPKFVESLVFHISKKEPVIRTVEEPLLTYAKLYQLESSQSILEKRLGLSPN